MNDPASVLILLVVLILLNAFFAGSEIAFVSLREGQLQRLEERSDRGRKAAEFARNPARFLSTVQVFITLASFFAAAIAAYSLSEPLADAVEPAFGNVSNWVALAFVTLVLAFVQLIFGELAPKRIALQRAMGWSLVAITPLGFFAQITRPIVWLLHQATNGLVRITGGDPDMAREEVTEEEIRDLLQTQESFTPDQRSIIAGAFEIGERTLREIVVPRGSVISIPETATAFETLHQLAEAGRSRAPVHKGDLDDVLGIIHVRDLINHQEGLVSDQARPATVLPESLGVLDALRRLQGVHQQMAIVVNEHGGVEGIITVEDLLEEIVGEIYDEFDRDVSEVHADEDGSITLPGAFPIHDLPDVGVEFPEHEGNYATIAGYVLEQLGHIPLPGEIANGPEWNVEVISVEDRAITEVRLTRVPVPEETNE